MKKFWIINLVIFQSAWFIAALLQQQSVPILLVLLVMNFVLSPTRTADFRLLLWVPLGWVLDYTLIQSTLFLSSSGSPGIPVWLMCFWCLFIVSLNHSMDWLSRLPRIPISIVGAMFAGISYLSAIKFGALQTDHSLIVVFTVIFSCWCCLFPLLLHVKVKVQVATISNDH